MSFRYMLLALFVALCACATTLGNARSQRPADLAADATQPMIADRAFVTDTKFFVRFRRGETVAYSGGDWAQNIDLDRLAREGRFSGPYLMPLEYERKDPWSDLGDEAHPVTILGVMAWRQFRTRLLADLVPRDRGKGLVLHFGTDDYFLYYDEKGDFHAVVMLRKPGDYSIGQEIGFGELLDRSLPVLRTFLAERGIDAERVGFNTGDIGEYALPFLYVNTTLKIAVFAQLEPAHPTENSGGRVVPWLRTIAHVVKSHVTGVARHPVSSVYRLLFVATDVVTETLRPNWLTADMRGPVPPVTERPAMDLAAWEHRLDQLTGRTPTHGNIHFLVDGEAFFTAFLDAASSARRSITLRMYIFDDDDFAVKIADVLKQRSNDGVDVRVLLDGFGTIEASFERQPSLPSSYVAPGSMQDYLRSDSRVEVRLSDNPWLTGDHAKTVVVDDRRAFMGGMNIAREYRYDWHDLMVELGGPVVDELSYEFDKAWRHAGPFGDFAYFLGAASPRRSTPDGEGYPIRVLYTRLHKAEIFHLQHAAIESAQRYIYVENPYFTDDQLLQALVAARRRGVDVRVVVPLVTDRGPITRNNILAANLMLEQGIRVFVFPGMSHVKAAVFDGWACLGSANWDRLSLHINKELNIATSEPSAVAALNAQLFERDFARSREITEPFPVDWMDHLIETFGDYIF